MTKHVINDTNQAEISDELFVQFEQLVSQLTVMKTQITVIQQNIKF